MLATTVLHSPVPAIGPRPCIQVTHKGGRGVESVQCSGQNIILRSCCCCCHGALVSLVGPSLGVLGGSQAPASQTSTWSKGLDSRRSLSLAHHQPAQPDDSDAIRFSDRSMPPIVFPCFSSALSFTTVVGHLMGDEVWIRVEQQCGTPLSRLAILSALRGGKWKEEGGASGGGCRARRVSSGRPACCGVHPALLAHSALQLLALGIAHELQAGATHSWHSMDCSKRSRAGRSQDCGGDGETEGRRRGWGGGGDAPPSATHTCQYVCNAPPPRICLQ